MTETDTGFSSANRYYMMIAGIILLGCAIRLVACLNSCVIINDGVLYIQQARALYYGEPAGVIPPGMPYLSSYPLFIAGAYYLVGDWVASALAVSWFFGCATLFPVFLLLRRFFDRSVTGLGLLLFAVMPVFVDISSEVIKEPVAYFFAAWGFHFFLRHLEEGSVRPLLTAGFCFIIASWTRIEILAVFGISGICLLFLSPRRWTAVAVFVLSLAALSGAVAVAGALTGLGVAELFRSHSIISYVSKPLSEYESLRAHLKDLALLYDYPKSTLSRFLLESRNLLWFTAVGAMLRCLLKTLFHPLALFFVAGLPGAWKLIRGDSRVLYLAAAAAGAFFLFYVHEVRQWIVYPRLMALMIIPSMFVLCCGIAATRDFLRNRLRAREAVVVLLLALSIVLVTLPKNTRARECDKVVFKEIGAALAAAEGGDGPFMVSASAANQRFVPFYANLGTPGAFHPELFNNSWEHFPRQTKERLLSTLHKKNITYMLWDERNWGDKHFPVDELLEIPGVSVIGTWSHADTGKMILLRLPGEG